MNPLKRLWRVAVALTALSPAALPAYTVEYAIDDFGSFRDVLLGSASITTATSPVRAGTRSFLHTVSGSPRRAELDINTFSMQRGAHWYGFSYYIPDTAAWSSATYFQYVAQWRFNNIQAAGFSAPSVSMNNALNTYYHGGSGQHMEIRNGRWEFHLVYQDPGAQPSKAIVGKVFDLGPVTKNVWTDWVVEGKWTHLREHGSLKVWRRVNGGAFVKVVEYHGATWLDTYAAGSSLAGQVVPSPNFTVGLYASDSTTAAQTRTAYSDEIRVSNTLGVAGFYEVVPGASPGSVDYGVTNTLNGAVTDWEPEGLYVARITSGPAITLVSDGAASEGGFADFGATTASGTMRLDVAALADTYNLKVRYRTGPDRGRFQVSFNGVNIGSVIDAYSASAGYAEVNLGSVTVSTAGAQGLRFVVNGKNTASSGFKVGVDRITLTDLSYAATPGPVDPINDVEYEVEDSYTNRVTSGPALAIVNDSGASYGQHVTLASSATGQLMRLDVPYVAAGDYRLKLRYRTGPDRAIVQAQLNNVNVGAAFDQYAGSPAFVVRDLGPITVTTSGGQSIKLIANAKNAASSGFTISCDYIDFEPVAQAVVLEAESSGVNRFTSGPAIVITADAAASGGQHVTLASSTSAPTLRLDLLNIPAGTYSLVIRYRVGSNQGRFQPSWNGVNVGAVIDQYGATPGFIETTVGNVTVGTAGTQQLRLLGSGKNAASSAYNLSVDRVILQ